MPEHVQAILDWLLSQPAVIVSQAVLLVAAVLLLAYGIFDGDPPLLWKKTLSRGAQRRCLWVGGLAAVFFFMALIPLPLAIDYFVMNRARLLVDGVEVKEGTWLAAFSNEEGDRLVGPVTIRLGSVDLHLAGVNSLPDEWNVHKGALRVVSGGKDLADRHLYVADGETRASVSQPLTVVDARNHEYAELPTSPGNFIFPRDQRVVLLDTRFLYRNSDGELKVGRVGSRLDCDRNDCGPYADLLRRYSDPVELSCTMVAESFDGERTTANVVFQSGALVATSGLFPPGTVLRLENPYRAAEEPVEVEVVGRTTTKCNLSKESFVRLGLAPGTARLRARVVDYLRQVPRAEAELDLAGASP